MQWVWKFLGLIVLLIIIYIVGCILYAKLTYYNPPTVQIIYQNIQAPPISKKELSSTIWNIGYCGLGDKSDFFYDGGKMMRPPKADLDVYFQGVMNTLASDSNDFLLLQEVDSHSKRSYFLDQVSFIRAQANTSHSYSQFALNYKVGYIPQPWLEPMGMVNSGLLSLSKYEPYRVERHQLPGAFGFPKQLFFLRRCMLVQYFHVDSVRDLVLINIHNSAYDDDGKLKKQEMDYLKSLLQSESEKGNYILCGGDWNQCPPDFPYDQLSKGKQGDYFQTNVEQSLIPNGAWTYDPSTATNRKNNLPYDKERTFVTIIDFFWHSNNISVIACKGVSNDFQYSDHQPVTIKFLLHD